MRRYLFPGLCVIALVLALHTMTLASGVSIELPVEQVEIVTANGDRHAFSAHIAATPEARRRGLMYVTRLEPDEGMLFDFESPRPVGMWMKNTPLSLDMLFIKTDGEIARIAARTHPFSTELISSGVEVRAVLEINGGRAAELGIAAGDRVQHPIFD
jgi:uncharacterized protein